MTQRSITFQIRPQRRVGALLCRLVKDNQQAAARAAQSVDGSQETAKKQRKAPPHLGITPHSGSDAQLEKKFGEGKKDLKREKEDEEGT